MHKNIVLAAILAVAATLLLSFLLPGGMSLVVRDGAGKGYYEKSVSPGDVVALGFNHSVEKVLVVDTFVVQPAGTLLLKNTTYGSSGAGLPSESSYNITVDPGGNFTIEDIDQTFGHVDFITGQTPKHFLIVSGEYYPIFSSVPEGKPLFLSVERNSLAGIVFNKIEANI